MQTHFGSYLLPSKIKQTRKIEALNEKNEEASGVEFSCDSLDNMVIITEKVHSISRYWWPKNIVWILTYLINNQQCPLRKK